jgi:hypothetical protein
MKTPSRSRLLLGLVLAGAAAAVPARAQTVQGRAVDRESQQPIPDASLVLVDAQGEVAAMARSGADGRFRVTAPRPGEYRLTASRIGYRTMLSAAVTLAEGQVVEVEARIAPQPVALEPATVRATGPSGISGRVLEADGDRPIAGATVTLMNPRGVASGSAVTDDAGRFHLRVRDPGSHRLRAERVGYARTLSPALTVVPDDTLQVELRMGAGAVVLAPLTVVAASRSLVRERQFAEFEWRRAHQVNGRFLGPDQVRRLNPFYASDVLQQVPFVQVYGTSDRIVTLRRPHGRGRCIPNVYVDGHYVAVDADISLDSWVAGSTVAAVEVYDRPYQAPAEFSPRGSNQECGVVVIWTRPPGEQG